MALTCFANNSIFISHLLEKLVYQSENVVVRAEPLPEWFTPIDESRSKILDCGRPVPASFRNHSSMVPWAAWNRDVVAGAARSVIENVVHVGIHPPVAEEDPAVDAADLPKEIPPLTLGFLRSFGLTAHHQTP